MGIVSEQDYVDIGVIGFVALFVLAVLIAWKWGSFYTESRIAFSNPNLSDKIRGKIRKRHVFHFCLLMAIFADLPLYAGFIACRGYNVMLYSFHKLQATFLFAAYSLTISDWAALLFEIKEDALMPFLLRKMSLIFLNVVFFIISVVNFVYCFTTADLQTFLDSTVYETDLLFMIFTPLILTFIMLRSGIKLSLRIQGAAGLAATDESNHSLFGRVFRSSKSDEFLRAVHRLNVVMAACAITIVTQATLMTLNFALGYYNKDNYTVGPAYFYYLFISIIPVILLTLSQLYLSHNSKLVPGGSRHRDALLFDYDSETSMIDTTGEQNSRSGLDFWRTESSWMQDSYRSHKRSGNSVSSSKPSVGKSSDSSNRIIRTTKTYRDPLLDFKYSETPTNAVFSSITTPAMNALAISNAITVTGAHNSNPYSPVLNDVEHIPIPGGSAAVTAAAGATVNELSSNSTSVFDASSQYSSDKHSFGLASIDTEGDGSDDQ